MICVPYKVRGTIRSYMWGDHAYMWGTIWYVNIRYLIHIRYGGPSESFTVTRFPQWTLIMKTLHIDSYKIATMDSSNIVHVGGWLGHAVDLFWSWPEKIISYMWRDHTYMWGDHMIPVPYKVRGTIRSYMWGDCMIPVPYKVKGPLDTYSI